MSETPEPDQINEIIAAVGDTIREAMTEDVATEEIIKRVSATLEEYLDDEDVADED